MRGRKPTPRALRVLSGTPRHKLPPEVAGAPLTTLPEAPAHLDAVARAEWTRLGAAMIASGVLAVTDITMLAMCCYAYSTWFRAQEYLSTLDSQWIVDHAKMPYLHPAAREVRTAMAAYVKVAVEFGLTPSSRTRVRATKSAAKSNDMELLLG